MTASERFSKYSTEELTKGIEMLEHRVEEHRGMMDTFEHRNDYEMFKQAESLYMDDVERLMDARLALEARK